ncbi:MAG TPA: hypothetical protein VM848_19025 [Acidimicrobiia bacterium]|nr:hypothetical protein [Acidimicrobiia bacterium]
MPQIACPTCGETENLTGTRADNGTITIDCGACGHTWERDARLRCRLCGADNLEYSPRPLWEKVRGNQKTPAGRYDAYTCLECGGQDVTSPRARPRRS